MLRSAEPGSYRGARRTLIAGTLLLFVGVTSAVASFVWFQAEGLSGSASDVGAPLLNLVLEANGVDPISTTASDSAPTLLIAVFVTGALLTALGLFLLVVGMVWTVVWMLRRGRRTVAPIVTGAAEAGAGRYRKLRGSAPKPALPPAAAHPASLPTMPGTLTAGDPLLGPNEQATP